MTLSRGLIFGIAVLVWSAVSLQAAETNRPTPAEIAHTLLLVQDQIATGNGDALTAVAETQLQLAQAIETSDEETWRDPKQGRALAIHLLSGGSPHLIRKLLDGNADLGRWKQLIPALLAFAERSKDGAKRLEEFDARQLDAEIAGQFTLAQAIAHAHIPSRSKTYLREARLLAPGGMIEDAAWRREIALNVAAGQPLLAVQAASRYLWRFGSSAYAQDVVRFLASSVIPDLLVSSDGREAATAFFNEIAAGSRVAPLVAAAGQAMIRGHFDAAAYTAGQASAIANAGSAERARATALASIAQAFTDPSSASADKLREMNRDALSNEERRLFVASLAVLDRIRAPLQSSSAPTEIATTAAAEGATKMISTAQALLDQQTR